MARTWQYPSEGALKLRPRKPRLIGPTQPHAFGGPLKTSVPRKRRAAEAQAEESDPDSDIEISIDSDSVFEVSDLDISDLELDEHVVHDVNQQGHEGLDNFAVDLHAQIHQRQEAHVQPQLQAGDVAHQFQQVEDAEQPREQADDAEQPLEQVENVELPPEQVEGVEQQPEQQEHFQVVMAENRMLAAVAVKPTAFNGLHTEKAQQWWANFHRYVEFAGIEGANRGKLLGLLLAGTAQLWFDSLPDATKDDYERLEAAFREKYIILGPNNLQVQMQALARQQLPTETVDEYIADARAKMANFNYNNDLQMTLILNGLRSDVKAIVLQHLPFANIEALAAKAKHVEAALKSYVQATPTATQQANAVDLDLGQALGGLTAKVAALAGQINRGATRPRGQGGYRAPPWQDQEKRCFICDSNQHLKRNCPQGQGQGRYEGPQGFSQGQYNRPRGFGQGRRGGRGNGRPDMNRGQGEQYNRTFGRGHGRPNNNGGFESQVGQRAWNSPRGGWRAQNDDGWEN